MTPDPWRMGFHLMPPAAGWLNDPNGLCHFGGLYHVFHQWSPTWPEAHAPRGWGHYTSRDLVNWEHHGMAIAQDCADDANGAYSGGALVVPGGAADGGDLLRLYYTGNVKEPGEHDFVYEGRQANEILVETADGFDMGPKQVLLRNADYPEYCSCHVRDPKIWREDGSLHMLLGARTRKDVGMMLVYRSADGLAWELEGTVTSGEKLGYMWECPDRIELDGHEYVACCPQGVGDKAWSDGVGDHSGYLPVPVGQRVVDSAVLDANAFVRWDNGFEFYAPQSFVDEKGRTILIGWMGMPEDWFVGQPAELDWIHCLTVPRELSRCADGRIAQWPVAELEELRGEKVALVAGAGDGEVAGGFAGDGEAADAATATLPEHRASLELSGIEGELVVSLDGVLEVRCNAAGIPGCEIAFVNGADAADGAGCGRTSRRCDLETVRDLLVLVDSSAVEVYANGGRMVFSTRWFPRDEELSVAVTGTADAGALYPMGSGMAALGY